MIASTNEHTRRPTRPQASSAPVIALSPPTASEATP